MKKLGFVIMTLIFTASLSGCNKSISYNTLYDNVIGTWHVDEVKVRQQGTLHKNDVTFNWDQYSFTFNFDESCTVEDTETGTIYSGYWYIDEYWTNNSDDSERKQDLVFQVFDPNTESNRYFRWKEAYANNRKLRGKEHKNGAIYYFKLAKS